MQSIDTIQPKRERIFGMDFARCICTIIIVLFHYACHTASEHKLFFQLPSGNYGSLAVTIFFVLSGASLFYNYPDVSSIKVFWFKRWKSIFPMYYLCSLFYFLQKVFQKHMLFYGPSPLTLVLTLLGVDGYFYYRIPNYGEVGEWFLGAIVFLYLLYPFMIKIMKKSRFLIPFILTAGYFAVLCLNVFTIDSFRNLITCATSFYIGILFMKHRKLFFENTIFISISSVIAVVLLFVPVQILHRFKISEQVHGIFAFLLLVSVGERIKTFKVSTLVKRFSKISFPVFLFQHKVILNVLGVYNPLDVAGELLMITVAFFLIIIFAKVLAVVNDALIKSKFFVSLEQRITHDA